MLTSSSSGQFAFGSCFQAWNWRPENLDGIQGMDSEHSVEHDSGDPPPLTTAMKGQKLQIFRGVGLRYTTRLYREYQKPLGVLLQTSQ